jgi:hypothetical protein
MVQKSDKNNVDEYYKKVNISTDKKDSSNSPTKKTFKVRAKKKVFIKKEDNNTTDTKEIKNNINKEIVKTDSLNINS